MIFRVTLINPTLGTLVLTKEPKGLSDITPTIRRGENHGLSTEIDVKLEFYCHGAGKEFIDLVRLEQGIDAEILINIDVFCGCSADINSPDYSDDYSDDYGSFINGTCNDFAETFYEGQLDLKTWTTEEEFTKVNINPAGILQTVKNRLDTKVDLFADETLDGTALEAIGDFAGYDLNLHSKEIIFRSEFNFVDDDTTYYSGVTGWTLEGSETDDLVITDSPGSERTVQKSFSQTLIPEIPLFNEVLDYTGDSNLLQSSATYPANNAQLQTESLILTINSGSDTYNISGKVKFAFNLYILIGTTNTGTLTRYFDYNITAKWYLQTGDTITLLQAEPALVGSTNFNAGSSGLNQLIIPLTEYTLDFTENNIAIADDQPIRLYVKFDEEWVIERPGALGSFEIGITKQCFVHEDYSPYEKSNIVITQESITEDTTCKAFALFEAGAQISRVITDQLDSFRSNIFGRTNSDPYSYDANGCGSFTALTNGFMIRGYPITGDNSRSIRISMLEFFQGLNAIYNLGLGIEKEGDNYYIVIDSKDTFYDSSTTIMTISNIPNLKTSEAPEYYYARVNIGYEKWETEYVSGLDEPNSKRSYDTGIKAVSNELNLNSNFIAGGYPLEIARRNKYVDMFSTDTPEDEENFIICLNRSTTYDVPTDLDVAEKSENFTQVNNIVSFLTAYNLRISPARNLLRWAPVINAGLLKYAGREIKFTSGEGNYKMTSEFIDDDCPGRWNNNLFGESQNVQWDDANNSDSTPIWMPEILEFNYPLSMSEFKTIEANPKGVFEVSSTDEDHIKAYILELKFKPNDVSEFKLLRAYV
jgi:hypothetical protein